MAFLGKLSEIGSVISSKSQEAANKAKELSGISQIKSKITAAENGIRLAYSELGAKVFEEHSDWIAQNYPEILEKVNGLNADIAQYNQDIENLKQSTADANAAIQEAQKARAAAAAQAAAEEAARKAEAAAQVQTPQASYDSTTYTSTPYTGAEGTAQQTPDQNQ